MRKYFYFLTDVNPLTKLYFSGPIFLRVLNVQFNSIWSKTGLVMVMCVLGSNPIPQIWPKLYHFLRWYDSRIMLYHLLPHTIRCNSRKCSYQQPDFYIIYVPDLSLAGALNPRTCKAVLPSPQPLFSVGVGHPTHFPCMPSVSWSAAIPLVETFRCRGFMFMWIFVGGVFSGVGRWTTLFRQSELMRMFAAHTHNSQHTHRHVGIMSLFRRIAVKSAFSVVAPFTWTCVSALV